MNILLLSLTIFYSVVPPLVLSYCLNLIYRKNHQYGWHFLYLAKYLITLSFLLVLFLKNVNFGIQPTAFTSVLFLFITVVLSIFGVKYAIKNKVLFFYIGGIYAAFMEEILYRGVIFGLIDSLFHSSWITISVTSFAFGVWHLKNFSWHDTKKATILQFLYTALFYGPVFAIIRIYTGDIYLAILFHYLIDASTALAPTWMRGWLVYGGRRKYELDTYNEV